MIHKLGTDCRHYYEAVWLVRLVVACIVVAPTPIMETLNRESVTAKSPEIM